MFENLKKGLLFSAFGKFSTTIITLIINAVLSRLLTPNDYGVVAVMQVFITFFQLIVEAGLGPAIIQNKDLTDDDVAVIFNYSIVLASFLAVFFGFFGIVIASLYGDPIYIKLSWIQSIAILFNGLSIVPVASLNKKKNFKQVNFNLVLASFMGGIVGILSALNGAGVYSLLLSSITIAVTQFVKSFIDAKMTLTRSWSIAPIKSIYQYSINQFGFNFVNYFSRNADNLLVGKVLGSSQLGYYSKAYQLLMMPNSVLLGVITPILHPILSDYQDDVVMIRKYYLKLVRMLALVGFSLSVFLSIFGRNVILFIFGSQWGASVIPFQILSLTVWIQMTLSSTGAVFQARNKTKELFYTGVISTIILVTSINIGIAFGNLTTLAISLSIGFLINFIVSYYRVMKLVLHSKLSLLIRELKTPVLVAIIEAPCLLTIKWVTRSWNSDFLVLLVSGSIFIVLFILAIYFTGELKKTIDLFKRESELK
ncbi:lipopolysaccharide biosynthesis protein [Globicatella sulfidifaciens]|uniref:lipopolysaccharide biosynthesis protein n=1 Tax=Globicatella sulfidifaciens TaxID=136093 RepID=UPI002891BB74|nr:lipopolysaccharide biosynthesis protein [Globicatella sulfidifaciens]MDT2767630.1 lipopolysaccharide biosynthesis protein [Globicatella sulfidifaciens]